MPARPLVPPLQPCAQPSVHRRAAAGCWRLAPGRALSLKPRESGVLRIARGRVWLSGAAPAQDLVLQAGDALVFGQRQVLGARLGRLQQIDHLGRGNRVEVLTSFGPRDDQAAVAQAGDVLGHRRLRQPEFLGQIPHAYLAPPQAAQDRQSARIGQRMEQRHRR